MLQARGFRKVIWAIGLVFMALGVVLTYSRSGLLAFTLSLVVCVWEYGIKGKTPLHSFSHGRSFGCGLGRSIVDRRTIEPGWRVFSWGILKVRATKAPLTQERLC
jgi:hypothetical protein